MPYAHMGVSHVVVVVVIVVLVVVVCCCCWIVHIGESFGESFVN